MIEEVFKLIGLYILATPAIGIFGWADGEMDNGAKSRAKKQRAIAVFFCIVLGGYLTWLEVPPYYILGFYLCMHASLHGLAYSIIRNDIKWYYIGIVEKYDIWLNKITFGSKIIYGIWVVFWYLLPLVFYFIFIFK